MKQLGNFKKNRLLTSELSSLFGGKEIATNLSEEYCDTLEDTNDNGKMDPGECITIVDCPNQ